MFVLSVDCVNDVDVFMEVLEGVGVELGVICLAKSPTRVFIN